MQKTSSHIPYLILFSCILLLSYNNIEAQVKTTSLKKITGKVTNLNAALADVNIVIKNRNIGTKTNAKGAYAIQAKTGDQIQYSYIGFKTITIVVEDITSILNVDMITENNMLEETVVLSVKKKSNAPNRDYKRPEKIKTSRGKFAPDGPSSSKYMNGKYINSSHFSIAEALKARLPFHIKIDDKQDIYVRSSSSEGWAGPAVWDVDGAYFYREPALDLSQIKDVYVPMGGIIRQLFFGPVIVVRTNAGPYEEREARKKAIAAKYTNKNYYNNDAVAYTYPDITIKNKTDLIYISGTVKNLGKPLANVNIIINNKNQNLKTNVQGNYSVQGNIGDLIQFRYMGFKTITIIVEDVTSILNINMVTEIIKLDETVIATNNYEGQSLKKEKKKILIFERQNKSR